MTRRRSGAVAALAVLAVAFAAPGAGSAARGSAVTGSLAVDLNEWTVVPSQGRVAAGRLRLTIQNYGTLAHELEIVPTRSWGQRLRVRNGKAVGRAVAPAVLVSPGGTRTAEVTLAPGSYVLLDNIRGHYALGTAVSILAT